MRSSQGKHVKETLRSKVISATTSLSLVSLSLFAFTSPAKAEPEVTEIECGYTSIEVITDVYGSTTLTDAFELNFTPSPELEAPSYADAKIIFNNGDVYYSPDHQNGVNTISIDSVDTEVISFNLFNLNTATDEYTEASVSLSAGEIWPLTIEWDTNYSEDVSNLEIFFEEFDPCRGSINDAETTEQDALGLRAMSDDAFDDFGFIGGQQDVDVWSSIESRVAEKSYDSETSTTVYTFISEDFYSLAEDAAVDVTVVITFAGNTVSWAVSAKLANTDTPADLNFRFTGDLGSDSSTTLGDSNGYTYSSDSSSGRYKGDPVIIYESDASSFTNDEDEVTFEFSGDASDGFVELTLIGYEWCALPSEISSVLDTFTSNYSENKFSDIPVVDGACTRACEPSTQELEASENNFDLSEIDLCFDTIPDQESIEPETITQFTEADFENNFGSPLFLDGALDYQDVAVGSDTTLNALLTITEIYGLELDDNELNETFEQAFVSRVDETSTSTSHWINTSLDYRSTDELSPEDRFVEYTLTFYEKGDNSKSPVSVSNLELTLYDIDGLQFFSANGVKAGAKLARDTILTTSYSDNGTFLAKETQNVSSASGDESRVSLAFKSANSFSFKIGITAEELQSGNADFDFDFSGGPAWQVAVGPAASNGIKSVPTWSAGPEIKVTPGSNTINVGMTYSGPDSSRPTSYKVSISPGGKTCIALGKTSSCDISGLAVGVPYKVSVQAINAYGSSEVYEVPETYILGSNGPTSYVAKKTIDKFPGDLANLRKGLKSKIKKFILNHPEIVSYTCTGYTAGPVKKSDKVLAKNRASNVCAYIEKIKPSVSTATIGKTPGLPWGAANRKVVIRGYSAIG